MNENIPAYQKDKAQLSNVWLYILDLQTPVGFVIFGNRDIRVQFKVCISLNLQETIHPAGKFNQTGSSNLETTETTVKCETEESMKIGPLPGYNNSC